MCVLISSATFSRNVSILSKTERYIKIMLDFVWSTLYSCPILIEIKSSREILEKFSSNSFHENPSCGTRVV
jgi:hypothetical protein